MLAKRQAKRSPMRGQKRVGIDPNQVISRRLLAQVTADVRQHHPRAKVGEAWTWSSNRRNWEFHGPGKFVDHFRASNAFEARYKGWVSWLKFMGTEGYRDAG